MIAVNELRIGNWVKEAGGYTKIENVYDDDLFNVCYTQGDFFSSDLAGIEPIPLTHEILLTAGFSNKPNSSHQMFWRIGDLTFRWYDNPLSLHFIYQETGAKRVIISTLHHLQNLVFALSGKELNIEL